MMLTRCYRWALAAVQFPAVALDLLDARGKVDHKKLVPLLVVVWLLRLMTLALAHGQPFDGWLVVLGIFLLAAAFGPRLFQVALSRSSFTLGASVQDVRQDVHQELRSESRSEVVLERRDPALGVEPAP